MASAKSSFKKSPAAQLEAGLAAIMPGRKGRSYWPYRPHPQQEKFLALEDLEALYGGAAGGGKSDALLMGALEYVHVPGYAALLLRRTFSDLALPGAIMDRAHTWLQGQAKWDDDTKTFWFPEGGRLTFGYLKTSQDRFRYQSAEFQYIGFDELTQFPELWYTYMRSRLRKPSHGPLSDVPLRLRGATNPGGIGHQWVRSRFIVGENLLPFVPAKLADNPSVDAASYREALSGLDEATRAQLEDGNWDADRSRLMYAFDPERNLLDAHPPFLTNYGLGLDFGYDDACAFVEWGWNLKHHQRKVYLTRSHKQTKLVPSDAADFIRQWSQERPYDFIVGDTQGMGRTYALECRKRYGIPVEAADKQNKRGYVSLFNGALEDAEILIAPGNAPLIVEMNIIPWNADRSNAEEGFENHLTDAALYGWRRAAYWAAPRLAEAPHETQAAKQAREEAEYAASLQKDIRRASSKRSAWFRSMMRRR